jgi:hypothetical protein
MITERMSSADKVTLHRGQHRVGQARQAVGGRLAVPYTRTCRIHEGVKEPGMCHPEAECVILSAAKDLCSCSSAAEP